MRNSEIRHYIIHRYPFLLVDRVLSYHLESEAHPSLLAIKNVTANEEFFLGHFPGNPVMPGVLIIETLAQAAGLLMAKVCNWSVDHGNFGVLAGVDNARFKRMVEPGDQLKLHVEVMRRRRTLWKFLCRATVDDEVACIAEILISGVEN